MTVTVTVTVTKHDSMCSMRGGFIFYLKWRTLLSKLGV
jgi:hypothetical protein